MPSSRLVVSQRSAPMMMLRSFLTARLLLGMRTLWFRVLWVLFLNWRRKCRMQACWRPYFKLTKVASHQDMTCLAGRDLLMALGNDYADTAAKEAVKADLSIVTEIAGQVFEFTTRQRDCMLVTCWRCRQRRADCCELKVTLQFPWSRSLGRTWMRPLRRRQLGGGLTPSQATSGPRRRCRTIGWSPVRGLHGLPSLCGNGYGDYDGSCLVPTRACAMALQTLSCWCTSSPLQAFVHQLVTLARNTLVSTWTHDTLTCPCWSHYGSGRRRS